MTLGGGGGGAHSGGWTGVHIFTDQRNERRSPPLRIVHKIFIVVVSKAVSTTDQRSCVVAVDVSMGLLAPMTSSISKHVNTTARTKERAASQRRQQGAPGVDPPKRRKMKRRREEEKEGGEHKGGADDATDSILDHNWALRGWQSLLART